MHHAPQCPVEGALHACSFYHVVSAHEPGYHNAFHATGVQNALIVSRTTVGQRGTAGAWPSGRGVRGLLTQRCASRGSLACIAAPVHHINAAVLILSPAVPHLLAVGLADRQCLKHVPTLTCTHCLPTFLLQSPSWAQQAFSIDECHQRDICQLLTTQQSVQGPRGLCQMQGLPGEALILGLAAAL